MVQKQKSSVLSTPSLENKEKSDNNIYKRQQTASEGNHRIEFYNNDISGEGAKWALYNGPGRVNVRIAVGDKLSAVVKSVGHSTLSIRSDNIKTEEDKKKSRMYQSLLRRIKEHKLTNFLSYITNENTTRELHIMGWQNASTIEPVMFVICDNDFKLIVGKHETKGVTSRVERRTVVEKEKEIRKSKSVVMSSKREVFSFGKRSISYSKSEHVEKVEYVTVQEANEKIQKIADAYKTELSAAEAKISGLEAYIKELEKKLCITTSIK